MFEFLVVYDSVLWEQQDRDQFVYSWPLMPESLHLWCQYNDVTWLEELKLSKLYINLDFKYLPTCLAQKNSLMPLQVSPLNFVDLITGILAWYKCVDGWIL